MTLKLIQGLANDIPKHNYHYWNTYAGKPLQPW